MPRMKCSTKAWCFLTGAALCAGSLLTARFLYGHLLKTLRRSTGTPSTGQPGFGWMMTEQPMEHPADEELVTEESAYRLTFPDGSPVRVGELQLWLDMLRSDPEVSDQEFVVAAGIVKQLRAHLN